MKLLLLSLLILSIGIPGVINAHADSVDDYQDKSTKYFICEFFFGVLSPGLCVEPTKPYDYDKHLKWHQDHCGIDPWDHKMYCDSVDPYK